jgi:hypothetical protein
VIEQRPAVRAGISIDSAEDDAVIVLAVRGSWNAALRAEAFAALQRCLAAHPAGLVVDLTDLDDPGVLSLQAWAEAREMGAAVDPPVRVALCASSEMALAHRLQEAVNRRHLPVFAKPRQARSALNNLIPAADRLVLHTPAVAPAPGRARRLIDSACRTWDLQPLLFNARLIVSELVANAVRHAGTDIRVTVLRQGRRLQVTVADADPRLPRMPTPEPGARLISGLHMVQAVAAGWGTIPTTGGKVVWASPRE